MTVLGKEALSTNPLFYNSQRASQSQANQPKEEGLKAEYGWNRMGADVW
jgi:hypothetical protein